MVLKPLSHHVPDIPVLGCIVVPPAWLQSKLHRPGEAFDAGQPKLIVLRALAIFSKGDILRREVRDVDLTTWSCIVCSLQLPQCASIS